MFGLFTTIIIDIIGLIAKVIMPGKENLGFLLTILLVATYPGQSVGWYEAGQVASWISSIVGAFLLLWIFQKFRSRNVTA